MRKILVVLTVLLLTAAAFAQKKDAKKVIFAVVNEGKTIEPIALIEKGELKAISDENAEADADAKFVKERYKPKTSYNLIFGGANAGTVLIKKDMAASDCGKNQAEISVVSKNVKPKGFVMALATDALAKKTLKGMRELPTSAERAEIEKLVMAEMLKENIPIKKTNELRYHNLTRVDVDNDGKPEFVGTFWYNTAEKVRSLMFFIADKDAKGNYSIPFKKFDRVEVENVMSGEISDVDKGIGHELLIDMFDTNGDGTAEIFTMRQAFEGTNFQAYKKVDGKWTQVLETYNYHCAF